MFLRKVLIVVLAAASVAAPAHAQGAELLMPGVTYERDVVFSSHGPIAVHVMTAPKPGGLWSVEPALSNGAIVGRDTLTSVERGAARDATIAGVNGDFFAADGTPAGLVIRGGVVDHEPAVDRSSIGIASDGRLRVERVRLFARWWGTGQRRPFDLNAPPSANGVTLFTPAWGPATPAGNGVVEAVLGGLPPTRTGAEIAGTVVSASQTNGGTAIPRDGAVLVGRGAGAGFIASEAPLGTTVNLRVLLSPDWLDVPWALGGGPILVRDRKPVFRNAETIAPSLLTRGPRGAVGQLADGRIVLAVVDGAQPGYSAGMTSFELAQTLVRLGVVTAAGLGSGPAASMAFEGQLLNRPPGGRETPLSDALLVLYHGVYVAPPAEPVLSPNGDGTADSQTLSYKLPRAATVTAVLVGPDGRSRTLESRARDPGSYRFTWRGVADGGAAEPEGKWRFRVTAVDADSTRSSAERSFALNKTLGSLTVGSRARSVRAAFVLAHPAKVSGYVETAAGAVISAVGGRTLTTGRRALVWHGRANGGFARRGRYAFRVVAANKLGRVELSRAFTLR